MESASDDVGGAFHFLPMTDPRDTRRRNVRVALVLAAAALLLAGVGAVWYLHLRTHEQPLPGAQNAAKAVQ